MIVEKPSSLKVKPNLSDYESIYKTFGWEDAKGELGILTGDTSTLEGAK